MATIRARGVLVAGLAAWIAWTPARAQDDGVVVEPPDVANEPTSEERYARALSQALAAFARGDWAQAERYQRELVTLDGRNFVVHYNLACAISMQGRAAEAADALLEAVRLGFIDYVQLRRDGQLASARTDPRIRELLARWPAVIEAHRVSSRRVAERLFSDGYRATEDEALRLVYLSAMDPVSTEQARGDIARLAEWAQREVFGPSSDAQLEDGAAFDPDPWVVVVLPTERDFRRWMLRTQGPDAIGGVSGVGGVYSHDSKRLVAQDLGSTLRHEFFHVLHWRSMSRLGQVHPVWVQEGLCSLVEDYDLTDGGLTPTPSWRTNIARRLATGGRLLPLDKLATLPRDRFIGTNPLSHYGQARTVFLYLYQRGVLRTWYDHYTRTFARDPSGVAAMEAALGRPIEQINDDYRQWVRELPMVAEQVRPGGAQLGIEVSGGSGDGPELVGIPATRAGREARQAGLRVGDVITAIDGRPTRELSELVRVLGDYQPGDVVEVAYRRRSTHGVARITLTGR